MKMWGHIYGNYMATFSKALMNPGFVQDQNENKRMNLQCVGVTYVLLIVLVYCGDEQFKILYSLRHLVNPISIY